MRTPPAPASLFTNNRTRLTKHLSQHSIAVIRSNSQIPTNADALSKYEVNSGLYYLSGIKQANTTLILFPHAHAPELREILFIEESTPHMTIWEGERLSKKQASELSGIATVKYAQEFLATFNLLAKEAQSISLVTNEQTLPTPHATTSNDLLIQDLKARYPLHNFERLTPHLTGLRMIKQEAEISEIKKAIAITAAGYEKVLKLLKPSIGEWEIEAEFAHTFLKAGSKGFAYTPIVASGGNACVLHYINNDKKCKDGELVLLDVACEWNEWNADITRCFPVNGVFTLRQRAVYTAVLDTLKYAETVLRPGILLKDYHLKVMYYMGEQLVTLNLISQEALESSEWESAVKTYYMHGSSHHLGLDVHDVMSPLQPVTEGMVFTIEPGLYIQEEQIGIRLENNYRIGKDSNENLSSCIPLEIEEIESLMA